MASSRSVSRAARVVQLASGAKSELNHAVEQFAATSKTLERYGAELTPEHENLTQTAIGIQAEAVRASMYALTVRGIAERLAVAATLVKDEGGAQ